MSPAKLHLAWRTVKDLDTAVHAGAAPKSGKTGSAGDRHRRGLDPQGAHLPIVVSDLERHRPIWFGGRNRSEASLDLFYQWLGAAKSQRVRLAVMDMWKPFRNSTRRHAVQASILFDKFLVMRHLGEALDQVRKTE